MPEGLTLTKQDLKEIVGSAVSAAIEEAGRQNADLIREIKKPTELEQAKIDAEKKMVEAKQAERKNNSAQVIATMETKRAIKRVCTHEHPNGDTHCVWIQEKTGPGYLLCQKNQCKVRPGLAPQNYGGDDIFDSGMFNRIFQKLNTSGADIIG